MEASQPITLTAYGRLLSSNANFRRLWSAQVVSEIGDWVYASAVYSTLLEHTGSAKALAAAFVMQVLPQCFMAPTAGVLNDRLSRRSVMIFADFARAVVVAAMVFARSGDFIWLIYVLLFLETLGWALFEPARTAVIPNITEPKDLVVANALSATTWSFNFMIGFGIGGAAIATFGENAVFVLNALSFILSGLLIMRMRFAEPHAANMPPLKIKELADFSPTMEGVRYVAKDRRLLATMLVKVGIGPMSASWVLFPMIGSRLYPLSIGAMTTKEAALMGMSALMGSRGIGALMGPLVGARFAATPARQRIGILVGFILAALGYLSMGFAGSLSAAVLTVILGHAGSSIVWVFSTTLLQQQTEDRYRGRVFSAEFAFMTISMAAIAWLTGVLIDRGMPLLTVAQICGFIMLLPAVLWFVALRLWNTAK